MSARRVDPVWPAVIVGSLVALGSLFASLFGRDVVLVVAAVAACALVPWLIMDPLLRWLELDRHPWALATAMGTALVGLCAVLYVSLTRGVPHGPWQVGATATLSVIAIALLMLGHRRARAAARQGRLQALAYGARCGAVVPLALLLTAAALQWRRLP